MFRLNSELPQRLREIWKKEPHRKIKIQLPKNSKVGDALIVTRAPFNTSRKNWATFAYALTKRGKVPVVIKFSGYMGNPRDVMTIDPYTLAYKITFRYPGSNDYAATVVQVCSFFPPTPERAVMLSGEWAARAARLGWRIKDVENNISALAPYDFSLEKLKTSPEAAISEIIQKVGAKYRAPESITNKAIRIFQHKTLDDLLKMKEEKERWVQRLFGVCKLSKIPFCREQPRLQRVSSERLRGKTSS